MSIHNLKINKHSFFTFALICMCNFIFAQNYTTKKIDSLLVIAEKERIAGNTTEFLKKQNFILKVSQKSNYSRGIAKAHYGIALSYMILGKSHAAIEHFLLTDKEPYAKTDYPLLSETNRLLGECYANLGLYNLAIEKHRKSISVVENVGDDLIDYRKAVNYLDIAVDLKLQKKSLDSNYYYLSKALYYIKRSPENLKKYTRETKNGVTAVISTNLGEHWETKNNVDSANYYYLKSLQLIRGTSNKIIEGNVLTMVGNFFLRQKQYSKAIEYFERCIKISKSTNDLYKLRESYKGISEAYKNLGNEDKSAEYSQDYIKINDSITASEKKGIDNSVNKIIKEEKSIRGETQSTLYWVISGILLLAFLLTGLAYWYHQKVNRKKDFIISDSSAKLVHKKEIIESKEQETHVLKQQINESFDEVVQLAKENSPEFFTRFNEVYPDVIAGVLKINPSLRISELTLCSYIYIGLSTKDIARYTFRSISTIKNRKINLKKKLNLSVEDNIEIVLKNLRN